MSGPAPTPTEILKMRGSPKADARKREPKPRKGAPGCPAWLDEEARAEWKRLIPELRRTGVLCKVDRAALAGLCANWSLFVAMESKLRALLLDERAEAMLIRRTSAIRNEAYKNYMRAACEFGLTPAARVRVQVDAPVDGEDELEEYLGRG